MNIKKKILKQLTKKRLSLKISIVFFILILLILNNEFLILDRLPFSKNHIIINKQDGINLKMLKIFYVYDNYKNVSGQFLEKENKILLVSGENIIEKNLKFDLYGKEYLMFSFNGYSEKHKLRSFKYNSFIKFCYHLNVTKNNDTLFFKWKISSKKTKENSGIIKIPDKPDRSDISTQR